MKTEEITAKILQDNPNIDRYQLAIAVATRCDQLENGAQSKLSINTHVVKSADLALMEIAEGLVRVKGFVNIDK